MQVQGRGSHRLAVELGNVAVHAVLADLNWAAVQLHIVQGLDGVDGLRCM